MEKFIKAVGDLPIWIFLVFFAAIILILSIFELEFSSGSFSSRPANPVFYLGIAISGLLFAGALAAIIASNWRSNALVSSIITGRRKSSVVLGKVKVEIVFGEIQSVESVELVVLPANEFFDGECISDVRSSLGAYFHSKTPGRSEAVRAVASHQLKGKAQSNAERVRNHKGNDALAYKIGTVVPIEGVEGLNERVALVSTTTHRADEGLVAREEYVFSVLRGVSQYCGENRIRSVAFPLVGSGHGQLTPRVSLISMLQAINSISSTTFITHIKVVVFKKAAEDAQIPEREIGRLIELATWLQQRPAPI